MNEHSGIRRHGLLDDKTHVLSMPSQCGQLSSVYHRHRTSYASSVFHGLICMQGLKMWTARAPETNYTSKASSSPHTTTVHILPANYLHLVSWQRSRTDSCGLLIFLEDVFEPSVFRNSHLHLGAYIRFTDLRHMPIPLWKRRENGHYCFIPYTIHIWVSGLQTLQQLQ